MLFFTGPLCRGDGCGNSLGGRIVWFRKMALNRSEKAEVRILKHFAGVVEAGSGKLGGDLCVVLFVFPVACLPRPLTIFLQVRFSNELSHTIAVRFLFLILNSPLKKSLLHGSADFIALAAQKSFKLASAFLIPAFTIKISSLFIIAITSALIFVNPIASVPAVVLVGSLYLLFAIVHRSKLVIASSNVNRDMGLLNTLILEAYGSLRDSRGIIVVPHRRSLLRSFDRCYEVKDGAVRIVN